MLRSVFATEVYVRLNGDGELTCTTRYAGLRVWTRRFRCMQVPCIPSRMEQCEPEPSVRQKDRRMEARRLSEG